jgi:hypothetical protein
MNQNTVLFLLNELKYNTKKHQIEKILIDIHKKNAIMRRENRKKRKSKVK